MSKPSSEPSFLTAARYDEAILHPAMRALFGNTGLYNIGFWRAADGSAIADLGAACRRLVERHLEVDPAPGGDIATVLDVGCGLGATTRLFAAAYLGATTVGVNYSPAQLAVAAATGGATTARFVAMDATALAVRSASIDRIYCVEAAMHFAPRSAFLAEAARVLAPGGRLVLTDVLPARANAVIPEANVASDLDGYLGQCRTCGLEPVLVEDITGDTVVPFAAHMRSRRLGNIARHFASTVQRYIIAVLVARAQ